MKKKKRAGNETVIGYCPFGVGSRYNILYRDRCGLGAHGQAQHDWEGAQGCSSLRHGPTIRPTGIRHGRPACGASGSTCSHGLATGVCHDTKCCIVEEGQPCVATRAATRSSAPYDTVQKRCYMAPNALRYDVGALRHARQLARHGAQCARHGFDS